MQDRFSPEKIVSLGTLCHTAQYLKTNGLKAESYPFDWVFASIDCVLHCLQDDFVTYLDKSLYIDANYEGSNKCGHKTFAGSFFNHRDARLEQNYAYYKRCVERFRSLLKSKQRKLFIIGFYGNWNDHQNFKILQLRQLLAGLTNSFRLVVVIQAQGAAQSANWENNLEIDYLKIVTLSKTTGKDFSLPEDRAFFEKTFAVKYQLPGTTVDLK